MIVPSIDLMNGNAVQLIGGKELEINAGDPKPLAQKFGIVGEIAVIDLDAALSQGSNEDVISDLIRIAECRVGGGIRTVESAIKWLDKGAKKIILGSAAKKEILRELPRDRVIAALDAYADQIKGRKIVCIVSGGNNDIDRMPEIKERSLQYEGLKHYFLINFAQRPGALKEFVNNILGPSDDITRFEYMQKTNKEAGPALVGIELQDKGDYITLVERMKQYHVNFSEINKSDTLMKYLV